MKFFRNWGPVILWAAAISGFSTSIFGSEHTSKIILPILKWFLPHASAATLGELHHLIRKLGHLSEYFVFGLLALRGFRAGRQGMAMEVGGVGDLAERGDGIGG